MNVLEGVPSRTGAYALVLYLPRAQRLAVGRLGTFRFPQGTYVYLGQAGGPGGLQARLRRHVLGPRTQRWHVDFLRAYAQPVAWGWRTEFGGPDLPLECQWSQALAGLPGVFIPAPGFGASDCRSGCPAHLFGLPGWPMEPSLEDFLGLDGFVVSTSPKG